MAIGYLLGGIAALLYCGCVGYLGGVKKSPTLIRMVKLKLGKKMSDEKAVRLCIIFATIFGALGVFLLIYGAMQG